MDNADLQKLFDGYNREIRILETIRYKHPEISPHDIAHLYKLSIGIQNTMRGLSQYDDAIEQLPLLTHIKTHCPAPGYGNVSPINNSPPFTRICMLEDIAYRAQQAGNAQLQRLKANGLTPNLQLELGVERLKQLTPKSFSSHFHTAETVDLMCEMLQKIHDALPSQPATGHAQGANLKSLKELLNHTREALTLNQSFDYSAQEALPILLDNADKLFKELRTASKPQDEIVDALFGLLSTLTNELPKSHANDVLKRKAQTLLTERHEAQATR